ncbi:MFS transporter [Natrinema sp. 1APR25-10V2]|uniref:MFS transporter n=1 Tax=Natrinema sp. 1APR25-10V2 TaxID=2951081 RepID=UPI00287579A6|nr:MFS transporter [Natrinema sp. 1APR25-10V2]MDS0474401.1 MFS transporter [Natrinema sp. 1APR25-10V2]
MGDTSSGALSAFGTGARELWSGGRGKVLTAVAGGWFLSIGVRMIYPVMLDDLQSAYGLDLSTAGLLLTVLFLAYALGQFPGGVLSDRFGERATLTASAVLSAVTLTLVVTAGSTIVLFAATALLGFGTALYAVGRYTVLSRLYSDRLGAANGVTAASQDAGQSVLPPIASVVAATVFWQLGFGFVVPLFLLSAAALWIVVPTRAPDAVDDGSGLDREELRLLWSVLRQPSVVYATVAMILGLVVWQAFTSFYPTYLIAEKGLSKTVASLLFGTFFALGILIKPLAGAAYDRFGIRRSLTAVASGPTVALVALPLVDGFWPLTVVTALVSTLLGFATVLEPSMLRSLPDELRGTGFGILRSISFTVGAASPALFGAAADRGFFDEAFAILAAFAGGMILLAFLIPER